MKKVVLVLDWDGIVFLRFKHLRMAPLTYLKYIHKVIKHSLVKNKINGFNPKSLARSLLLEEKLETYKELLDPYFSQLIYKLYERDIPLYIVSSSRKNEIEKYLKIYERVLRKLHLNFDIKIIASTQDSEILSKNKKDVVKSLKEGGYLVLYVGDSYNDRLACEEADICFVKKTLTYYISPKKPKGKAYIRSLKDLSYLLDAYFKNRYK